MGNLQKSIYNNKTNYDYPNRRSIENLANPLPRRCHGRQERHPIHPRRHQGPKLYVMKALQSLKSKGLVKENYTWQHYHWALTDEGITYLREQLSLPENVMPNTLKRTQEPQARPDRR